MKEIKRIMMMLVIAIMASSTMMADDLTFFELKGPVKTVVIKDNNFLSWPMLSISSDSYSLTFTKEGKLVTPDGNQITRNKNIKVIKYYTLDEWWPTKYTTDASGRIINCEGINPDGTRKCNYFYNENGFLTKLTAHDASVEYVENYVQTYIYTNFDHYGNRTKRVIHGKISSDYDEPQSYSEIETREITYYK